MLAVKLYGKNDIRIVECDVPQIGADEILVKTSAAAICGSDLRMIENGYHGVDETHPIHRQDWKKRNRIPDRRPGCNRPQYGMRTL